jgi:WD40 repeat protein
MPDASNDRSAFCPVCGRAIEATNPGGQCAFCLLQLGLSDSLGPTAGDEKLGTPDFFLRQGVLPAFGDYVLEAEIARGGMGVVYRARQISLDRSVAIKMILAGQLASPEMIQRFKVEAQSASRLRHPGIIPIYEIGEWETQHYFSMELVDGASLAQCMEDFRLKENARNGERKHQQIAIAELMCQVARALDFAHQRGVLHRDVKPSNILIDEHGHPRLTDFGLAKLKGQPGATSDTSVLGTPGYAAPEQGTGAEEDWTTAADVYAFGATLYQLLTGKPPFSGPTALATLRMAGEKRPVTPRQINPAVHRDMETIAMRCLEIKPQDRYHSAEAVAEELERFVKGQPILARPIGRIEQLLKWCRQNPALSASLLLLAVAIAVGTGAAIWQARRVQRANVQLTATVADLKWNSINDMLRQGQASTALATVASMIRQNPDDPKPAMFAMSLLEQRRFPLPAAPQIRHPNGAALSVARLSPDRRRIATASFDGTVRIWDAATSVETVPALKHDAGVNWVEFSPNGLWLVSCSADKTVRFWKVQTGEALCPAIPLEQAPTRAQFNSDGTKVLVQTSGSVSLIEGFPTQPVEKSIVQEGRITSAGFLSNQRFFIGQANGKKSSVSTWDAASRLRLAALEIPELAGADLNTQANRVAVIGEDGRAWVADFPSGLNRCEIARDQMVQRVLFSPSGQRVAALGLGHWARVFAADSGKPLTPEFPHYYVLNGACFFDDEKKLLTWGSDSLAQAWDIDRGCPDCEPMRHTHRVVYAQAAMIGGQQFFLTTQTHSRSHSLVAGTADAAEVDAGTGAAQLWSDMDRHDPGDRSFGTLYPGFDATRLSPDGRWVAFGTEENAQGDEDIRLLNASSGAAVCPPMVVRGGAWGLAFTPDGSRMISATSSGQVTVWAVPNGVRIASPVTIPAGIHPAEISADGKTFATGSPDGSVRIWDTATAQPVRVMQHGASLHSLAFSPDGTLLASAGADYITRLWDTRSGSQVRALIGHTNEVMTVFFSPDGRKLVTGSFDFTARIWDTATGKTLAVLPHQGEVLDVAFSPDGRYVATASRDCTAVIWDASTGQAHCRSAPFEAAVRNVRFSPDGTRLFTLDFHGLQVWDVASGHPLTVHMTHEMDGGTGFQDSGLRFDLTSDGQTILLGADSPMEQLWHLPNPPAGAPAWFADFLESVAAQRLTPSVDLQQSVPSSSFLKLADQLRSSQHADYYSKWALQWLANPPDSRGDK